MVSCVSGTRFSLIANGATTRVLPSVGWASSDVVFACPASQPVSEYRHTSTVMFPPAGQPGERVVDAGSECSVRALTGRRERRPVVVVDRAVVVGDRDDIVRRRLRPHRALVVIRIGGDRQLHVERALHADRHGRRAARHLGRGLDHAGDVRGGADRQGGPAEERLGVLGRRFPESSGDIAFERTAVGDRAQQQRARKVSHHRHDVFEGDTA